MEYITKDDLEEYIDIIPSENGDDDYDTRTVLAKNIFEWLKDKKFKQDLEVDHTQFGNITSFFAAERVSKLIELIGEVEQLWSYYFMPRDLIVDFNSHVSGHISQLFSCPSNIPMSAQICVIA